MSYEAKLFDPIENVRLPFIPSRLEAPTARVSYLPVQRMAARRNFWSPCDLEWVRTRAISLCNQLRVASDLRDDVLSDIYLALHRAALRYDERRNPNYRAYLHSVIRCAIIDFLRGQQRYHRRHPSFDLQLNEASTEYGSEREDSSSQRSLLGNVSPSDLDTVVVSEDPESLMIGRETFIRLHRAIECLPKRERAVVVDHYFHGKSLTDVANERGYSKSLISSLHRRALIRLKHKHRLAQSQS